MNPDKVREGLYEEKTCVIFREKDAETVRKKARACRDGGLRIMEVTWTTPKAVELVAELAKEGFGTIGAGTILTVAEAKKAVAAGATFLVSPVYTPEVNAWCKKNRIVYVPGCGTVNEIYNAWQEGCRPVKVFPAPDLGGPAYIKHILAPLPALELLPTSGLGLGDLKPYLDAGAKAVGLGSAFTHAPEVAAGGAEALARLAERVVEAVKGRPAAVAVR